MLYPIARGLLQPVAFFALALGLPTLAVAGGTITFDNQSPNKIKIAAPGGSAVVESGAGPTDVTFDTDIEIGLDINIWWVKKPRELCQIFSPYDRVVIVTGKRYIACRSHAKLE